MATAKTGSFYLTETVELAALTPTASRAQGEIDLGAYVNVPTGQAIAVESVDWIFQNTTDLSGNAETLMGGNGALSAQLVDLNPGTEFVRADDQSLIASGVLNISIADNIVSYHSDVYPDNHGPSNLSEMFLVVSDTIFAVVGVDGNAAGAQGVSITARIKCRVVKLSTKDWMAIAIQSTASDN